MKIIMFHTPGAKLDFNISALSLFQDQAMCALKMKPASYSKDAMCVIHHVLL